MGVYVKRSSEPTNKTQPGFNWIIRRFRSKRCADTKKREKHKLKGQLNGCVGFCTFRQFAYFRYLISDARLLFLRFHPWFDRLNFTCVIHLLSNPYDNNNVINERNNNTVLPRRRFSPIWNLMKILHHSTFFRQVLILEPNCTNVRSGIKFITFWQSENFRYLESWDLLISPSSKHCITKVCCLPQDRLRKNLLHHVHVFPLDKP